MKQLRMSILASAVCALALAMPAATTNQPQAKTTTTHSAGLRSAWAPETLSGTITMVDPDEKLVVVKGPDGVPFDMMVSRKTHIVSGGHRMTLQDLEQYRNKQVSIRFVPERHGDVAESIRING